MRSQACDERHPQPGHRRQSIVLIIDIGRPAEGVWRMGGVVRRALTPELAKASGRQGGGLRTNLCVAFVCCVVAGPSWAASQRDKDDCTSNEPERVIAGCTRIVQDRTETTKSQASAFNNRGSAYFAKGDYNRAIADLTEAIRL